MAIRVTAEEVKEIIDTDLIDSRVDVFIIGANRLVEDHLVGKGLTTDTLKEIERWLSAHNIAATIERQAIEEVAGPAEQKFANVFAKGLWSTTYGQTAISMDTTGILEELAQGRRTIKIKAIGE